MRSGPIERDHRCLFANLGAERARSLKKKVVKQAALDADHTVLALRKIDPQFLAADGDEFYGVDHTMRPISNLFGELEFLQDQPARRIDAIAADFFAREFFTLQNQRSQSGGRAKRSAGRTGRSATDNRNIENLHLIQSEL